jgi:amino acid transporter
MSHQNGYQSIGGPGTPPARHGPPPQSEKYVSFAVPTTPSSTSDQVVYLDTPRSAGKSTSSSRRGAHGSSSSSSSSSSSFGAAATSSDAAHAGKKIGLAPLVVLIFYSVSGGPFGIEDIVRAGGPRFALMGFALLLVWAVPEALITAELSTALPGASGSVGWVDAAFGPFWAFQKGWLGWLSGVSDNALYPILFLDCLIELFNGTHGGGGDDDGHSGSSAWDVALFDGLATDSSLARWAFILAVTAVLTFLTYRGLDVVGNVAILVCLLSLMPFAAFCVLAAPRVDPSRWALAPAGGWRGVDWRLLLNTFFWNINFWESAASFSGDVEDPGRMFPLGLSVAVGMVFLSCFLPVLVGLGVSPDPYTEWSDGYFVRLATETIGPWLGYWMMFGAAITNIGMFVAEMSSDAWQVAGMADTGILPRFLGHRNPYGAPTFGVLLSASGVVCLGWLSFSEVVDMLNLLFCYGQAIEFGAFLWLRWKHPDMPRPFRIGIGFAGMAVILFFPLAFIGVIMYFSSRTALVVSGTLAFLGVGVYYVLEVSRALNICQFNSKDEIVWIEMQSIDPHDHDHHYQHEAGLGRASSRKNRDRRGSDLSSDLSEPTSRGSWDEARHGSTGTPVKGGLP